MLNHGGSVTLIGITSHMPFELLDLASDPAVPCKLLDLEHIGALWLPPRRAGRRVVGHSVGECV